MKKFISLFALLAMLIPFVANAQEQETKDTLLRANTDTLMKHIRILSSSQYEGRMAGSEAYLDAANYCCGVLASYGVQPFQGEWGQYFEVEYNERSWECVCVGGRKSGGREKKELKSGICEPKRQHLLGVSLGFRITLLEFSWCCWRCCSGILW